MSFDSPSDNIEKEFPGLYGSDSTVGIVEDHEKQQKKKEKKEKKDKQKDKKDKGYQMFEEDDDMSVEDFKSPGKLKKAKPFKFQKKDIFPKSKDKDIKKEVKEKRKEEKESKKDKTKVKDKKKSKHGAATATQIIVADKPVFGVALEKAVERSKCHDGIELPALVRECIDYIEEYGLTCEGIYRISGVKSKVQLLKEAYNKGIAVDLCEHEPNIVASLLKQFLRDLPEPVLTTELMPKFEETATIRTEDKKVEAFSKLLDELPLCNRLLLSWMIVHMSHIIQHHQSNKMSLQNVSIVLSPTMQISHRVLNIFFSHSKKLFKDTVLKRYVPPLKPASSKWSLELPDTPAALEEELAKQESLLNQLHEQINSGRNEDPLIHEQLWEVQRIVTQLKRKIKLTKKAIDAAEKRKKEKNVSSVPIHQVEVLDLQMRQISQESIPTAEYKDRSSDVKTEDSKIKVVSAEDNEEKVAIRAADHAEKTKDMPLDEKDGDNKDKQEIVEKKEDDITKVESNVVVVHAEEGSSGDDVAELETKQEKTSDAEKSLEEKEDLGKTTFVSEGANEVSSVHSDKDISNSEIVDDTDQIKYTCLSEEESVGEVSVKEVKDASEEQGQQHDFAFVVQDKNEESSQKEGIADEDYEVAVDFSLHDSSSEAADSKFSDLPVDLSTPKRKKPQTNAQKQTLHMQNQFSQEVMTPIKVTSIGDSLDSDDAMPYYQYKESVIKDDDMKSKELDQLKELEYTLALEEEELRAMGDELRKKLESERNEIERLRQEITELQMMRHDSDCEDYSSTSDSSIESEGEPELREVLNGLIADNEALEKKNAELCQKIHEERMICLGVKVQIRLIQQKQLESDNILDRDNPF